MLSTLLHGPKYWKMSTKSGASKGCKLPHMDGGAEGPQQELLRKLSAAGVPLAHIQLIEPLLTTLQPARVVELCRCVPRLLLVQGRERSERGSAQSAEVLAMMAARRQAHKARLREYMNLLRPLPPFRTHLPVLQQVVSFLAAGQTSQTSRMSMATSTDVALGLVRPTGVSCKYACVAHGCRLTTKDIVSFLQHVQELHM